MKIFNVNISTWEDNLSEDYVINWEHVTSTVGHRKTDWLINLPKFLGQLVLEKTGSTHTLVAELYTPQTLYAYRIV